MPEDLAPYEKAARIYCANTGVDPDKEVPGTSDTIILGISRRLFEPQWKPVARRLVELSQMLVAMRQAADPNSGH